MISQSRAAALTSCRATPHRRLPALPTPHKDARPANALGGDSLAILGRRLPVPRDHLVDQGKAAAHAARLAVKLAVKECLSPEVIPAAALVPLRQRKGVASGLSGSCDLVSKPAPPGRRGAPGDDRDRQVIRPPRLELRYRNTAGHVSGPFHDLTMVLRGHPTQSAHTPYPPLWAPESPPYLARQTSPELVILAAMTLAWIDLASGRSVEITNLTIGSTYGGVSEGYPNADERRADRQAREASRARALLTPGPCDQAAAQSAET